MANDKSFKIKNGLSAGRYLGTNGTETAGTNGPYGVFDTTLYTADGTSSQTITNNIDLSTDGGLVLLKSRDTTSATWWYDTERGATKELRSDAATAESTESAGLTAFNTDGFTFGTRQNQSAYGNSVAWTFKQASNFFDVVTYTGNGSTQNISHNLGSVPGTIIVKKTNSTANWITYHRSLGNDKAVFLNLTSSQSTSSTYWNATTPTSSVFSVGANSNTNGNGDTFVAYLFAHDTSDDGYIQCGGYTTDANEDATVTLGWKPSWLLVKRSDGSTGADWRIIDSVRGVTDAGDAAYLEANTTDAEAQTGDGRYTFTDTGFTQDNFGASRDYIYVAIRAVVPTQTLDLSTGHTFSITPTEATDVLFSNPPASGTATGFTVEVNGDGSAITWPSSVKWHLDTAPTATASKEVYTFITTDGGTTYYGKKAGENLA